MLKFEIPGRKDLVISSVVFDYNGTLAVDGHLIKEARELLPELARVVEVYVLTADTFGLAAKELAGLPVQLKTFDQEGAADRKVEIVNTLQGGVACVGNGMNDIKMCDLADLAIAVITEETMCAKLLLHADVFAPSIKAAIEVFLKPGRLKATLRN